MSERQVFAEFRFLWRIPVKMETAESHPVFFLYFTKTQSFVDILSAHK